MQRKMGICEDVKIENVMSVSVDEKVIYIRELDALFLSQGDECTYAKTDDNTYLIYPIIRKEFEHG